ncbi:MAG: ATP/GTP-binding protein [bacterium]
MLINFSVANYTSFNEEVTLNMIPTKSRTMKGHIISDPDGKKMEVLPVACIYGANASGKSNLVKAMEFAQELIINGTRAGKSIDFKPFLLDTTAEKSPGRFEFVFKHDGILYTYGFVVSANTIHEEWLFAFYSMQESKVFERVTKDEKTTVDPGARLVEDVKGKRFIEFVAQGTRPNQLFLTEAGEKNIELLKPVLHWFSEHLTIVSPYSSYNALTLRAHKDSNFLTFLSTYLQTAGTGITDIHTQKERFDSDKHLEDLPKELRKRVIDIITNDKFENEQMYLTAPGKSVAICTDEENGNKVINYVTLKTDHINTDGARVSFDTQLESDGTRRLMHLVPLLLDIWEGDGVYVIDEIERSLHPHLSRLFLETCIEGIINKRAKGQLILTTHDTNLLDRELLRRDEVWFMEKDQGGASHMTSLAEYKVSDGLNYENGYLNGRFGGIPYIGDVKKLMK